MSDLAKKLDEVAGMALINALSLLISDRPSFLRGGVGRKKGAEVEAIFPGGKLPFPPTSPETPEFNQAFAKAKKKGKATMNISPESIHNRQLSKIPGGVQNFVNQLRSNYERDVKNCHIASTGTSGVCHKKSSWRRVRRLILNHQNQRERHRGSWSGRTG